MSTAIESRETIAIAMAIHYLKEALDCLKPPTAPYTRLKIKSAIKSAEGAHRHAQGRYNRGDENQPRRVRRVKYPRGKAPQRGATYFHDHTARRWPQS